MDTISDVLDCRARSPLHGPRGKQIMHDIRARCLKRSRKYTLKDLNELRHLAPCRAMPDNICHVTDILSPGLGLSIVSTNSFSTTKEVRLKQLQYAKNLDGYKNYVGLIPNKNERIRNVHPSTPTISETLTLSKRNFDKKVKMWKKEIHRWDAIQSVSEIPYHLLTKRMLNERNMRSANYQHNIHQTASQLTWSPRSPQKKTVSKTTPNDGDEDEFHATEKDISSRCIKQLIFDEDEKDDQDEKEESTLNETHQQSVYSPSKNQWYKLKNGASHKVNITKESAIDCLKLCIENVRKKQSNDDIKVDSQTHDELIVDEFVKSLQKMFV